MAKTIDQADYEAPAPVTGQGIQEQPNGTDVPGGSNVPKELASSMVEPQPGDIRSDIPARVAPSGNAEQDLSNAMQAAFDQQDYEALPDYANGSTPLKAVNKSPLSVVDRLKMSVGNKMGNYKYLKENYTDVKIDKYGNFVVQKDGLWHKVDPVGGGDGDAWERTKEVVKDMADMGDVAISTAGMTAGAVLGGARGAPAGPVGIAVMGASGAGIGGEVAEGLKTSLGRLAGTYEATPEEQIKDIGWEGMLAMGGEIIPLGVKPKYENMSNALKKYGAANNTARETLATVWGDLMGKPKWTIRRAIDNPEEIIPKADMAVQRYQSIIKETGGRTSALSPVDVIQDHQVRAAQNLAVRGDQALKAQYRKDMNDLLKGVGDNFSANPRDAVESTMLELQNAGWGKVTTEPGRPPKFQLMSDKEIANMVGAPEKELPKIYGEKTRESLQDLVNVLNQYGQFGPMKGRGGAEKTLELRKAIKQSMDNLFDADVPGEAKAVATKVKNMLNEKLGKPFADAGLGEDYIKMNQNYAERKDLVDLFKKASDSKNPQDLENLVKKLSSGVGKYRSLKTAGSFLGPEGNSRMQSILDWEAAKSFVDFGPSTFQGGTGTTAARIGGAMTGQSNPRLVGREIQYGSKMVDTLKNMGPKQLDALMRNDVALRTFFQIGAQGMQSEDEALQNLLQSAGINASEAPPKK